MTEADDKRESAPEKHRQRGFGHELSELLGQVAIPLATALSVWLFLRDQVLDAYVVPTPSMEPTIEGDPQRGDRVLVDKTFDQRRDPERFDMVVFWLEKEQQIVVKRVAGLPGESLEIRDGDLFVGGTPQSLTRVVKSVSDDADLFARYWDHSVDPQGFASTRWRRQGVELAKDHLTLSPLPTSAPLLVPRALDDRRESPWSLEFLGKITTGYLDAFGGFIARSYPALDFGVELTVSLEPGARLWLRIDKFGDPFTLCCGTGGHLTAFHGDRRLDTGGARLPELAGQPHELRCMWLDGGLVLGIDGQDVLRLTPRPNPDRLARANGIGLATTEAAVRIDSLRVIRDLHYLERGRFAAFSPEIIPDDHYFLLGDNSEDSRDSRYFGAVHKRWLRGRPLLVAAPLSRFHVFRR